MRAHEEDSWTAREYVEARNELDLTQEQLAYVVGVTVSTIKKREGGATPITREAQLSMEWLLENPPLRPPDRVVRMQRRPKVEDFRVGDRFGLFTFTAVNVDARGRLASFGVKCQCGREKLVMPTKFHFRYKCHPSCPAFATMVARGARVDAHGYLVDKDGFPEF